MEQALAPLVPLWVVPSDQVTQYGKAQKIVGVHGQMPMKPKQLNYALDAGFAENQIVVTMDDDFVKCVTVRQEGKKFITENASLADFIIDMAERLMDSPYYAAGFQSNLNPAWCGTGQTNTGMVLGQLLAHKKSDIRFDESLTMLEDLEYIIAHHSKHGGIVRINDRMIYFHMESEKNRKEQAGGYKGQRDKERQQAALDYISQKYSARVGVDFLRDTEVGTGVTKKMRWKNLNKSTVFDYMEN
jgi:hypothetical protein